MIETREAIENVEAILDVEGLDGAFIGKNSYFAHCIINSFPQI